MIDPGAALIVGGTPQQHVAPLTLALAMGIPWLAFLLIVFGPEIRADIRRWRERRAIRNDPRRGLDREKILP